MFARFSSKGVECVYIPRFTDGLSASLSVPYGADVSISYIASFALNDQGLPAHLFLDTAAYLACFSSGTLYADGNLRFRVNFILQDYIPNSLWKRVRKPFISNHKYSRIQVHWLIHQCFTSVILK